MAYLSLYRKHRPRTFSEVVGQEHVTRTLINAITEDRLHHAYLFTGQRGTGKTSTARILAAAVNCENGPTPNPCGTCEQCVSIVAGRNVDVVELDMASNGGVDDARDLRDRAVFAPAAGRKKVYILDEVHMASTAAFNALLKVVEEPPPHVLFAMATTDPQKVLPTIMSRVQRLDLRRVTGEDLTGHLRHLGAIEGYTLDDEAAAAIAAAGDGSVRDTLSILEQVIAFAADDDARVDGVLPVTGGHVTRVLGATPFEMVVEVVDKIADADVGGALTAVQQLLDGGHDLRRFTLDLARHLRDLMVLSAAPNVPDLVDVTAERHARLVAQAQRFGMDTLVRAVETVGDVLVEQRQGPPRLPLELAVARLSTPGADGDLVALADRVARLEKAIAGDDVARAGAVPAPATRRPVPSGTAGFLTTDAPAPAATPVAVEQKAVPVAVERTSVPAPAPVQDPTPAPAVATVAATPPEPAVEPAATEPAPEPEPEPAAPAARETEPSAAPPTAGARAAAQPAVASEPAPVADAWDDADPSATAPAPIEAAPTPPPSGEELAARAKLRADTAGPLAPPPDLADRPGTTHVETESPPPLAGGDELAAIAERWESILAIVGERSRRAKAFYDHATPTRLGNNVLLLTFPASRRFHAEQGKGGEMTAHLSAAVAQATGMGAIRIDVRLDDAGPQRPTPAPMADAPADDEPTAAEVAAVTEVEAVGSAATSDASEIDALLRSELGAERIADDDA